MYLSVVQACKNIASLLMYLYTFRVIHHSLMYDLISTVLTRFEDADIEILLMLVKGCGQTLRSDDPSALRDVVTNSIKRAGDQKSQSKAKQVAEAVSTDASDVPVGLTRSDYLLEMLSDLKNNKLKFQDKDVTSNIQRVKRLVDGFMRERFKTSVPPPQTLKIAWKDLVGSTSKGRWWLGGNFSVGLEPSTLHLCTFVAPTAY
jgi:nucleolar MIF4G domain-containing protein 1